MYNNILQIITQADPHIYVFANFKVSYSLKVLFFKNEICVFFFFPSMSLLFFLLHKVFSLYFLLFKSFTLLYPACMRVRPIGKPNWPCQTLWVDYASISIFRFIWYGNFPFIRSISTITNVRGYISLDHFIINCGIVYRL